LTSAVQITASRIDMGFTSPLQKMWHPSWLAVIACGVYTLHFITPWSRGWDPFVVFGGNHTSCTLDSSIWGWQVMLY